MDNVKYQVFISSTYSDLIEERREILGILLSADCIPVGMENFVATDEEQFKVIKKVIDLCDYYILIIGKRYGSVNEKTGISYTEMEYNYAIDKGIPVLVFAIDDLVELDDAKIEKNDNYKQKLKDFKSRAMRNRMAKVWKSSSELIGQVAVSIMKAKDDIKRPGWRRVDLDNESVRNQRSYSEEQDEKNRLSEFFYNKEVTLHFTEKVYVFTSNTIIREEDVNTTLDELFKFVSLRLTGISTLTEFVDAVSAFKEGYYVEKQDALCIRNKYEQLGLIESFLNEEKIEVIQLTPLGKRTMNELNKI